MSFNPGGGNISGAGDVALSSPANNEVLTYDGAIGKWKNKAAAAGSGSVSSVNSKTPDVSGNVTLAASDVNALDSTWRPAAADISDASTTGQTVLKAANAAAARTAIGAGTSNLALGTTNLTAKAGNYTPPVADLPGGVVMYNLFSTVSGWPARPTSRSDIVVFWLGGTSTADDPTSSMLDGDYWLHQAF